MMTFKQMVEEEKQRLIAKNQKAKANQIEIPTTLAGALRLAADLVEQNEKLEQELSELRMNREYPEVLQSKHIVRLLGIGQSTLTEWASDPEFPHLDGARKKGETIRCLKEDFYRYLKNRKAHNADKSWKFA